MKRELTCALVLGGAVLGSGVAQAAASRTFVSTTGSDANTTQNCAATAPCRTFTAALGTTASGGEVIVLNSGGYGPFTVTQSVSITAPDGVYAGVSVPSGAGITIATPGVRVALKGISVNGTGGNFGILMTDGAALTLVDCSISGISSPGGLNGNTAIYVPTAAKVRLLNVVVRDNDAGLELDLGAVATVSNSQFLGNYGNSIDAYNTSADASLTTIVYVSDSVIIGNGFGLYVNAGISSARGYATNVISSGNFAQAFLVNGANATLVVGGSFAMSNYGEGFSSINGGKLLTAGNNVLAGNGYANTGTVTTGGLTF